MNKKIILFTLIAGLSASLWSCGSKDSSSSSGDESSAAEVTTAEITTAETLELGESFTLDDGNFRFSVPVGMAQTNNTDYEYTFMLSDNDTISMLGITSVSYMHQTATGFGEGILKDHEDAGFKDVKGEAYSAGDIPAYCITAIQEEKGISMDYRMDLLQFGNGDLLCINTAAPEGELAGHRSKLDAVISSVEYLGEPLKSGSETVDNDRFSLTVGEELYIRDPEDDENVYISYNLTKNDSEYLCRLELTVFDDMTPEEAADKLQGQWEKNSLSSGLTRENGECLGYDAVHMHHTISFSGKDIDCDSYHFEAGGTTYWLTITSDSPATEQFKKDIQPVLDSISFK